MATTRIEQAMQRQPLLIEAAMQLSQAAELLIEHNLSGAPVVNAQGELQGFVSQQDCLQPLLVSSYHCEGEKQVSDVMHAQVLSVTADADLLNLAKQMTEQKPKIYPVVDGNKVVGVINRQQVLQVLLKEAGACSKH